MQIPARALNRPFVFFLLLSLLLLFFFSFLPFQYSLVCVREGGGAVIAWGNKWHWRRPYIILLYANTSTCAADIYPGLSICMAHPSRPSLCLSLRCRGMQDGCHVALSVSHSLSLSLFLSMRRGHGCLITGRRQTAADSCLLAGMFRGNSAYANIFSAPFTSRILGVVKSLRCHMHLKIWPGKDPAVLYDIMRQERTWFRNRSVRDDEIKIGMCSDIGIVLADARIERLLAPDRCFNLADIW